MAQIVQRGVRHHRQRHHFQRAEHRAPGQRDGRRAGEIQVMAGADDAARQEDRGREQRRLRREGRPNQAQPREEEGDHRGGEDFEEAFHPQVDHPPAPVFDDRQMRVLSPRQARAVEQPDGAGGEQEEPEQAALLAGCLQAPDESRAPPGTARAAVRRTAGSASRGPDRRIRSPDGPRGTRWRRRACSGCSAIRRSSSPTTITSSAPNSTWTPERLELRLLAADQRPDEQAGGQPRRGDPEDAELHVPGARDAVGQDVRDLDAVEAVALDAVVRGDDAQQDLHQDQRRDDPEVLERRALRRRGGPAAQRIGVREAGPRALPPFARRTTRPSRRCRPAA